MTCKECERNFVWKFTNKRTLCREHFIRYFEKKVRYTLRRYKMLDECDVLMIDKNDAKRAVLIIVMNEVCKQRGCRIIKNAGSKRKIKIVGEECLDDISFAIINEMINGKEENMKAFLPFVKQGKNEVIRPLYLLLEKEIELYATLKGIKLIKTKKNDENKTRRFIDELEASHPEVKNAVVNGYLRVFE